MNKPREFWLVINREEPAASFECLAYAAEPTNGAIKHLVTHVIEYSAYKKVCDERDEATMSAGYSNPENDSRVDALVALRKERDGLKTQLINERDDYLNEYNEACELRKERDALLEQNNEHVQMWKVQEARIEELQKERDELNSALKHSQETWDKLTALDNAYLELQRERDYYRAALETPELLCVDHGEACKNKVLAKYPKRGVP